MTAWRRVALALGVGALSAAGPPASVAPDRIDLAGYDVVIMGETHDNPAHHVNQADWVRRMAPAALVFEMLTPELARDAEQGPRDPVSLAAAARWAERGWPDFAMYQPIFAAAPDAAILGGDVSSEALRRALRDGAATAMGTAAPLFGLDLALPRQEEELRESIQADSHCNALPAEALPGLVEAQRLRDAALAQAVIAALSEAGSPVAVITGNGHARTDWGLPAALRSGAAASGLPDPRILSIGQLETAPGADEPYDVVTVSAPPPRGDPCAAFR